MIVDDDRAVRETPEVGDAGVIAFLLPIGGGGEQYQTRAALEQARKFDEAARDFERIAPPDDPAERAFLFDCCIYPARLMAAVSRWGGLLFTALDRHDRGEAVYAQLAEAEAVLAKFMELIPRYCHGKWQNW